MQPAPRIFVYKLTTDNGGAPCVEGGLLSLAICKPKIRCRAKLNDWIIGLGGRNLGDGIIYAARVTKIAGREYYRGRQTARRSDCIYHFRNGELTRKKTALYHEDPANMAKDIGTAPRYRNVHILLSSDFRYFGRQRESLPEKLCAFAGAIGRGHRVNHDPGTRQALLSLMAALWQKHASRMKLGKPHSQPDAAVCCSRDEGVAECLG